MGCLDRNFIFGSKAALIYVFLRNALPATANLLATEKICEIPYFGCREKALCTFIFLKLVVKTSCHVSYVFR